ncbi:MAG: hypothetical protein ACOX44_13465 [Limnochordia bacterium]
MELQQSYPHLLTTIENELYESFDLQVRGDEALALLREQAENIKEWATEPRLKRFMVELTSRPSRADWRESLGRVIMDGKAPSHWTDNDVPQFRARLRLLAGDFMRLYELDSEQRMSHGSLVVRVSVLDGAFKEVRTMTSVSKGWDERLETMVREIQAILGNNTDDDSVDSAILRRVALAKVLASEIGSE